MATTHSDYQTHKLDSDLMVSETFAKCFRAFLECSAEIQEVIRDMVGIVTDPQATADEREGAIATIAEALFPSGVNGAPGVDLEESEKLETPEGKALLEAMDREEATFAERVQAQLKAKGMTQGELAMAIGIGQPAVSMMLARQCRPQRRTVERIAQALRVSPEELWPGFKSD